VVTCADGYGAEVVDALGDALGLEELELFPETTVRGRGGASSHPRHPPHLPHPSPGNHKGCTALILHLPVACQSFCAALVLIHLIHLSQRLATARVPSAREAP
jgi:hypothetical protein